MNAFLVFVFAVFLVLLVLGLCCVGGSVTLGVFGAQEYDEIGRVAKGMFVEEFGACGIVCAPPAQTWCQARDRAVSGGGPGGWRAPKLGVMSWGACLGMNWSAWRAARRETIAAWRAPRRERRLWQRIGAQSVP